jgi:hypothetical protein
MHLLFNRIIQFEGESNLNIFPLVLNLVKNEIRFQVAALLSQAQDAIRLRLLTSPATFLPPPLVMNCCGLKYLGDPECPDLLS